MSLEEYKYIWTENRKEYVLVKMKDGDYSIFNRMDKIALIIEDDDIYDAVINEMLKSKCEIVDSIL
ncbi:hypothetical protein [Paenibacillus glacialis]|uniref:Uncharacterized protein n=1 Tax=Paenibacillus glacialis TaxID=494026 RepID=A0A168DNP1_9BACL|nr:hypothetical protein [Paenibacillus glacialis]OAB34380.1 hypothetical protein PGLA_22750 [Paenibacillus glacialis]